jgi:hypothetical protein
VAKGFVTFTAEELERIDCARVLVSAGDFELSYTEFIRQLVLQGVDEIEGVNDAVARRRARAKMKG